MSELRVGSTVTGPVHSLGHLHQVIIDPGVIRVAHVVVVSGLGHEHRAAPSSAIVSATYDELRLDLAGLDDLPSVDFGRHEAVIGPDAHPELRAAADGDQSLVVAGSGFPVVDARGETVGHVDEWWSDESDPAQITHAVVERSAGIRLDHWIVVPAGHLAFDEAPALRLSYTSVDLDALPHHPVLPGVHLASSEQIDLSDWTPADPDTIAFGAKGPPGSPSR